MLDYWYSARCTRQIKLVVCILTCVIIYLASTFAALDRTSTIISLILGMGLHIGYQKIKKMSDEHPYQRGFHILFIVVLILIPVNLVQLLFKQHSIALLVQCVGFTAIGLFMLSLQSQRAKPVED